MTGFGKDPKNPFTNSITTSLDYSANRQAPLFTFVGSRLAVDPLNPYASNGTYTSPFGLILPNIPGYVDSLGNASVSGQGVLNTGGGTINYFAYFSAYGNGNYDPNDVNFVEVDDQLNGPIGMVFQVSFPINAPAFTTVPNTASSLVPNPYTSSVTVPGNQSPTFLNPQSFQIISSGIDGLYGMGGQYSPDNATESLPLDTTTGVYFGTQENAIRIRERDNVTNFHNGKLE